LDTEQAKWRNRQRYWHATCTARCQGNLGGTDALVALLSASPPW